MRKINKNNKTNKRTNQSYNIVNTRSYSTYQRPRFTFLDPHMYLTMHYSEIISTSLLTVAGSQNLFRMNSIFDPNSTGSGTQPYGYDTVSVLYNRYRVLKTRFKITFLASTGTYTAVVLPVNGVIPANVADQTTFTSATMLPFARNKVYSLGAIAPTFSGKHELNVIGGVAKPEYLADDRFEAQIGANPAEVINLLIGIYNPTGGTIVVAYLCELFFEVDLHDPILQAAS